MNVDIVPVAERNDALNRVAQRNGITARQTCPPACQHSLKTTESLISMNKALPLRLTPTCVVRIIRTPVNFCTRTETCTALTGINASNREVSAMTMSNSDRSALPDIPGGIAGFQDAIGASYFPYEVESTEGQGTTFTVNFRQNSRVRAN